MKLILVLLFLSYSLWAQPQRSVLVRDLNQAPQRISGIEFPRNDSIKYRGGSEAQFDRTRAVLAMLGADEPLESLLFSGIRLLLMKERCSFCLGLYSTLDARGFNQLIAEELLKNNSAPFTATKAREIAFRMMEADLKRKLSNGSFLDEKLDYRSPRYELFPQDLVFTTVHLEVANIYSRFITAIRPGKVDAVDLNFWNKIRNGAWVFTSRKWVDRGEFITPILIEADNIIGFYEYLSQVPSYTVFRPLPAELDFAFMEEKDGNEELVIVFDGRIAGNHRATAIIKDLDNYVLASSQFDPDDDLPKMLSPGKARPSIIGVFKLCPQKASCKLSSNIFKKYKLSRRPLESRFVESITSTEINGLRPKLFLSDSSIGPSESVSEVPLPTYPSSRELVNKSEADEKHTSIERIAKPSAQDETRLTWDFSGKKLPPNGAIYLEVPETYRKKKLKSISILQRQDESDNSTPLKKSYDKSPAYTSIQLFALSETLEDKWRYVPYKTKYSPPKDAIFAEIKAADLVSPVSVPFQGTTLGYQTDTASNEPLSIGALRLLGIGKDPATLYKLELDFE